MSQQGGRTAVITGTAILAALVVVFDYALKYSGLKIPFPLMPELKFDFTGIPILLSFLMYGLPSAFTTSLVALFAIVARSGNVLSASMKALSEFTTVLGFATGVWICNKLSLPSIQGRGFGWLLGVTLRIIVMGVANLILFPVSSIPFTAVFNLLQGSLSIILATFLHEAVRRRIGR
jgi:riboflavin transporter FmnP